MEISMQELMINGLTIELERKKIKNMYLRVLPPDGRIHISAPQRMKEEEINKFVLSRFDWIEEQQSRMLSRSYGQELKYVTGEEIRVLGRKLLLKVSENGNKNLISFDMKNLYMTVKSQSTTEQREKVLYDWYRKLLEQEIPQFMIKWESIIGVKSSSFQIRNMKTRWGTCNVRSRRICFNLQLAKKPPACLEYVVVHELVHLLEKSHNYIFKSYMDQYLPDWRSRKKELNNG
jgi:predicted metal-dependent hydrolase